MASVTICSDFGAQKIKPVTVSTVSPSICLSFIYLFIALQYVYICSDFALCQNFAASEKNIKYLKTHLSYQVLYDLLFSIYYEQVMN